MQLHSSYDSTVAKARVQYQIIMLFQTINLAYWRLQEILRLDMLSDFERLLIIRLPKALISKSNLTAELGMAIKMLGDWSICILFCSLWDQELPQVKYMRLILQLVRSRTASSVVRKGIIKCRAKSAKMDIIPLRCVLIGNAEVSTQGLVLCGISVRNASSW